MNQFADDVGPCPESIKRIDVGIIFLGLLDRCSSLKKKLKVSKDISCGPADPTHRFDHLGRPRTTNSTAMEHRNPGHKLQVYISRIRTKTYRCVIPWRADVEVDLKKIHPLIVSRVIKRALIERSTWIDA